VPWSLIILGVENLVHKRKGGFPSIMIGFERKKNRTGVVPTHTGQSIEDRKNRTVAIAPREREVA
jgi:hypothetical protein